MSQSYSREMKTYFEEQKKKELPFKIKTASSTYTY